MIWTVILSIFAILVGLIVVTFVTFLIVGRFLRKEYSGEVEAILDRPLEDVWKAINDFDAHPVSAQMCRQVTHQQNAAGEDVWIEDIGSSKISVTIESRQVPNQLVRKMVDGSLPMISICAVDLESIGDGCRITASNAITVNDGTWHVPFFRSILFFFGMTRKGMKAYVTHVAKGLETKPEFSK